MYKRQTQYCIKHSQVGEVKDFTITDADYVDFKKMLHKRKFTYDRQSEKMLKNLKEIAEFEGYMDGAKEEFAALEIVTFQNLLSNSIFYLFREPVQLMIQIMRCV